MDKPKEYSEEELQQRGLKKKYAIQNISAKISSLRKKINSDIKSGKEKDKLTALVIYTMLETSERVGNGDSADNGHFGVTGFKKNHINTSNRSVTLDYVGKSGVKQSKTINNSKLASALSEAMINSPNNDVFVTSDGFKIKNDRVNRYLNNFNISAKDIRGYSANKWIISNLKRTANIDDEAKRKKHFNSILKKVSEKVGHSKATLKKHYLVPELEFEYVENSKVIELSKFKMAEGGNVTYKYDKMKRGNNDIIWNKGYVKMKKGGVVTYKDKYNKKYGYAKGTSHSLKEISKDTGVSMKGIQQIYNKGIGAYKTNPSSVRPNVKSKEQWAVARVYSSVMGGKASKVDAKELKMEMGGNITSHPYGGWGINLNW